AEATRQGNMGWFLLSTGRFKRAIAALEYALKQSEKLKMPLHIAVQTTNLALAHSEVGEHDTALTMHRRALTLIELQSEPYWTALILINLAGELIRTGSDDRLNEAESLIKRAAEIGKNIDN